jgi:hypothetical protein
MLWGRTVVELSARRATSAKTPPTDELQQHALAFNTGFGAKVQRPLAQAA